MYKGCSTYMAHLSELVNNQFCLTVARPLSDKDLTRILAKNPEQGVSFNYEAYRLIVSEASLRPCGDLIHLTYHLSKSAIIFRKKLSNDLRLLRRFQAKHKETLSNALYKPKESDNPDKEASLYTLWKDLGFPAYVAEYGLEKVVGLLHGTIAANLAAGKPVVARTQRYKADHQKNPNKLIRNRFEILTFHKANVLPVMEEDWLTQVNTHLGEWKPVAQTEEDLFDPEALFSNLFTSDGAEDEDSNASFFEQ
jgi:hypothetical protein